MISNSWSQVQ